MNTVTRGGDGSTSRKRQLWLVSYHMGRQLYSGLESAGSQRQPAQERSKRVYY
ncbi:hypothetical protein KCP73_02960 [Salmonella enterica subsp. enterica]|nr:hypothetical protein KCP73_02960 [Salmonella enterica subsp. enterica]